MKKHILIMLSMVIAAVFGSCSKDDPFGYDNSTGETGGLLTKALNVSLSSEDGPRSLKNRNVRVKAPSKDLFKVAIYEENGMEAYKTYDYANMPEIVTLPIGTYYVKAYYGDNEPAAWDAPYYEGISEIFEIKKDQITDTVAPIECAIANVRVSIELTENLKKVTHDYKVTVEVNDIGSLVFTPDKVENGESGYFKYIEGSSTLGAVFEGIVDGAPATETKADINVLPGRHYTITFKLYDAGEEEPGSITGDENGLVSVDSTVKEEGIIDGNIYMDEENVKDDMRPTEGNQPGTEDPDPDQPENPETEAPSVAVKAPLDINKDNELKEDSKVEFVVKSFAASGITGFTVVIDSNVLDAEELGSVGIPPVIDLINCDDELAESLSGFGFPVKEEVKGAKQLEFDINDFVSTLLLIASFNDAPVKYYNFTLKVTDANGVTEKTLKLYNN